MQRHPPVLQEDQAPHAGDRRPGDPRGAGLWAAGELGGQAGSPSCSLGGHGHVLGLAPRAFSSLRSCLSQAAAQGRGVSGLYVPVRVETWPL